jgi:hypothetical protein
MADIPPPGKVTCPLCDNVCKVPLDGSVNSLPNNVYALQIIELKNALTERDKTITKLSSTNAQLNSLLENGQ